MLLREAPFAFPYCPHHTISTNDDHQLARAARSMVVGGGLKIWDPSWLLQDVSVEALWRILAGFVCLVCTVDDFELVQWLGSKLLDSPYIYMDPNTVLR
jgi:hypothetical protein